MKQDDLLYKWLNGGLDEAEMQAFKQREDYAKNLEILESASAFKAGYHSSVSDFRTFKERYNAGEQSGGRVIRMPVWLRAAAVLVIGLGLYFTLFDSANIEVATSSGEKTLVILPDNSEIRLNALSNIEYNEGSWESNRSLNLDGEAYFKVSKGKTFDVVTSDGVISVLGTQFNVKIRKRYFEVRCYEGMVSVSNDTLEERLPAGRTLRIVNNKLSLGATEDLMPTWIGNYSRFDDVPLGEVLEELGRQFGLDLKLDKVDSERIFTGRFTHDDIEKAIIEITTPMNLTYELNGSTLQIHGNKDR